MEEVTNENKHNYIETNMYKMIHISLSLMKRYVEKYPKTISEPDFEETFERDIKSVLYNYFDELMNNNSELMEEIYTLVDQCFHLFYDYIFPRRSFKNTYIRKDIDKNIEKISERLHYLKNIPQPQQRTNEWYEFRHNLITASNAYKAFESQAVQNQLIFEKCQPLITAEDDKFTSVNVNSTLHWGQKYEPVSVMIYEDMYKTKIGDFGCIKHNTYHFLGASPDGINIDKSSERYGRMLEIKNIVNREINGIPKKEYWIQMQLQMEVCDLEECDFLETKFIEYPDYKSYTEDVLKIETENEEECAEDDDEYNYKMNSQTYTSDRKRKGIIIYFQTKEGKPYYVYKPLNIIHELQIEQWEEEQLEKYRGKEYNYTFIKYIYWKLEICSCVLVLRNNEWFKRNIEEIKNIWEIIEKERVTGHDHRTSSKKIKKTQPTSSETNETDKKIPIESKKGKSKKVVVEKTIVIDNEKSILDEGLTLNKELNEGLNKCLINLKKVTNKPTSTKNTKTNVQNQSESVVIKINTDVEETQKD
jgi:putative phage-type endonuclease